jgi:hypothetical protein
MLLVLARSWWQTVAGRVAFWQQVHERLAKLSNCIDPATRGKLIGSLHEKIPMPTADEQQALQLENADLARRRRSRSAPLP